MIVGRTFLVIDMRIKNFLSHNFADLYHEIRAAGGITLMMYRTGSLPVYVVSMIVDEGRLQTKNFFVY